MRTGGRTRRAVLGASLVAASGCLGRVVRSGSRACPPTVPEGIDARLGFVGDVMLGRGVDERWTGGPPAGIWGSMAEHVESLDGLFCNLECCLSDRGTRRPGRTYHFRADPGWAVPALEAGGVTWASLANNHVLDYGPVALGDTTSALSAADIAHAGAGPDLETAIRPSFVDVAGIEVAVLAFTDRSPSYGAGTDDPGTAYLRLDPTIPTTRRVVGDVMEQVRDHDPDLVVASLHWGPNWETRPSPVQQRFARWLVDRGVDLVHGHSAHVVQGVEVYRGRPIVYDAGDFVDDYAIKPELHNDRSILFELVVESGRVGALRLVPVEIRDEAVHRAESAVAAWLRERMRALSEPFGTTLARDGDGLRVPLRCAE